MKQKLNLLVSFTLSLMTTMKCLNQCLFGIGNIEEKGGSLAIGGQGLGFVAHEYTLDQGAVLKFCIPNKESQFCCTVAHITVVQVHRALQKACLQALGRRYSAAFVL